MTADTTVPRLLLTVPEAAHVLSVGSRAVWLMLDRGELPRVKIGHSTRIPIAAITQWIEDQT